MKCKYVLVSEIGTNNSYYMPLSDYIEIMEEINGISINPKNIEFYEFTDEELLIAEKKLKGK